MPFTTTSAGGNGSGIPGPQGEPGAPGADGVTPFTLVGAYNNGADYTYGDAVYYNGGTYVRTGNPNNPGYPPTPGSINGSWTPIADKGDEANLGYITVATENDPVEGYYTTLEAPGQIVIQSSSTPGLITIQSYEGLQVNTNPENGGIYINSRDPEDKVVTAGDLQTAIGVPVSYNPTWSGTGLAFTGTPATGSYMKLGKMVTFRFKVVCTTVTNFGTGQYSITLPFNVATNYQFMDGAIHRNSNEEHYQLKAHIDSGNVMSLWIGSGATDDVFDHNSPYNLTTSDYFYLTGTYEAE
jgi:hypothetical protein